MRIFRIFVFILFSIALQQCKTTISHPDKIVKDREVYILSGGHNGAYGHHVIRINRHDVGIDTSFFAEDYEFQIGMDSLYFYRNYKKTQIDISTKISNKYIYKQLLSISIDTLKEYEKQSFLPCQNQTCTMPEFQITESGIVYNFRFFVPVNVPDQNTEEKKLLFGLNNLFPFVAGETRTNKEFYK